MYPNEIAKKINANRVNIHEIFKIIEKRRYYGYIFLD